MTRPINDFRIFVALTLWAVLVGSGIAVIASYDNAPGNHSNQTAPTIWPDTMSIPRSSTHPTLVMAIHPQCPCSRASLNELNGILAHINDRPLTLYLLFFQPDNFPVSWQQTDLWHMAQSLPHTNIINDTNGQLATALGLTTSGETALYLPTGELAFHGGITPSRGHEGDNIGRSSLIALLRQQKANHSTSFTFGCNIHTPNQLRPRTNLALSL